VPELALALSLLRQGSILPSPDEQADELRARLTAVEPKPSEAKAYESAFAG